MKLILINPKNQTVTEVEHDGSLDSIYKHLECDCFTSVNIGDNDIYVDDEGLLMEPEFFFQFGELDPLAGNGLISSYDQEGETIPPTLTVEEVKAKVTFSKATRAFYD